MPEKQATMRHRKPCKTSIKNKLKKAREALRLSREALNRDNVTPTPVLPGTEIATARPTVSTFPIPESSSPLLILERHQDNAQGPETRTPSLLLPRKKKLSRKKQLALARSVRLNFGRKSNGKPDEEYHPSSSSGATSDEDNSIPEKVPNSPRLPESPSPPSVIVRHQREDNTQGLAPEGNASSAITDLPDDDFRSLVDLIKSQRCCGCSSGNMLLQLNGSSKDTGISPQLLDKINKAISC